MQNFTLKMVLNPKLYFVYKSIDSWVYQLNSQVRKYGFSIKTGIKEGSKKQVKITLKPKYSNLERLAVSKKISFYHETVRLICQVTL